MKVMYPLIRGSRFVAVALVISAGGSDLLVLSIQKQRHSQPLPAAFGPPDQDKNYGYVRMMMRGQYLADLQEKESVHGNMTCAHTEYKMGPNWDSFLIV